MELLDYYNYDPRIVAAVVDALVREGLYFKQGIQKSSYEQTKRLLTDKIYEIVNKKYKAQHTGIGKAFYTLRVATRKIIGGAFKLGTSIIYTLFLPVLINSASYKQLTREQKKEQSYAAEKFCDNFAASFGYAKGVVETFNKSSDFTYSGKIASKIPIIRIIDYYSDTLFYFVKYMNDEHPSDQKRVVFAMEKLKHELEQNRKNLSPQQIKEIEDDIEAIEKLLKKTPYFKKAIDKMFAGIDNKRDAAGSAGTTDKEIYDFDSDLLKDKITKEDVGIEAYMAENYNELIESYHNEPVMEILSE